MAQIDLVRFTAGGAPHEIAVSGQHRGDLKRLARDVKAVCEWQIRLFGAPPPFTRYVFCCMSARIFMADWNTARPPP